MCWPVGNAIDQVTVASYLPEGSTAYPPSQTRPKPCRKDGGGSSGSPVPASKPVSGAAPLSSTAFSKAPEGVRALSALAVPARSVAAPPAVNARLQGEGGAAAPSRGHMHLTHQWGRIRP